jgi:hypothetical protein
MENTTTVLLAIAAFFGAVMVLAALFWWILKASGFSPSQASTIIFLSIIFTPVAGIIAALVFAATPRPVDVRYIPAPRRRIVPTPPRLNPRSRPARQAR